MKVERLLIALTVVNLGILMFSLTPIRALEAHSTAARPSARNR